MSGSDAASAHTTIIELEKELLSATTRGNPSRLRELLHPEFVEIGRSGRRWTRDTIIDALVGETGRGEPITSEWEARELGSSVVLVTYLLESDGRTSRHSSVWDASSEPPRMLFHQGTFVAE